MMRLMAACLVMAMFSLSIVVPPLRAEQPSAKPAESVEIPLNPLPFVLKGSLRRPDGEGPFPAVILLPATLRAQSIRSGETRCCRGALSR